MAKKILPRKLERIVSNYIDVLRSEHLPIKKALLYGSYAKGTPHQWSDVDLCIISPKFKDPYQAMQYLLSRTIFDLKYTIEPVGFTPKDFREGGSALIKEIKKTGIEIPVKE